jgi:hypothetical protein
MIDGVLKVTGESEQRRQPSSRTRFRVLRACSSTDSHDFGSKFCKFSLFRLKLTSQLHDAELGTLHYLTGGRQH